MTGQSKRCQSKRTHGTGARRARERPCRRGARSRHGHEARSTFIVGVDTTAEIKLNLLLGTAFCALHMCATCTEPHVSTWRQHRAWCRGTPPHAAQTLGCLFVCESGVRCKSTGTSSGQTLHQKKGPWNVYSEAPDGIIGMALQAPTNPKWGPNSGAAFGAHFEGQTGWNR